MSSAAEAPTGSALRLVLAAERLFALHGIDGVSLRQISAESGSANNSAVHYHFGSKDGLVEAIFRHRIPQLLRERQLLHAQCAPGDLRGRFSAQYLPLLHMAEDPENHYVSFVEQLQRRSMGSGAALPGLPEEAQGADDDFRSILADLLPDLADDLRILRVEHAQLICVHAAVDREHAIASGAPVVSFPLFVNALLDGVTGFLTAPPSDLTLRHSTSD